MLKFGNISEVNHASGLVRVELAEDGIVTKPLSYVRPATRDSKYYAPPVVGEHVAVHMDADCVDGVVLGAIYAPNVDAPGATPGLHLVSFADGGTVDYDETTGTMTVSKGPVSVVINGNNVTIEKGGDSLGRILSDLIDQLAVETHTSPNGPTSPPINSAAYTAIKTRLNLFLG